MIVGLAVFAIYLYFFVGIHEITTVLTHVNSGQYALFYSLALLCVLASCFSGQWLGTPFLDGFQSKLAIGERTCIIGQATLWI